MTMKRTKGITGNMIRRRMTRGAITTGKMVGMTESTIREIEMKNAKEKILISILTPILDCTTRMTPNFTRWSSKRKNLLMNLKSISFWTLIQNLKEKLFQRAASLSEI